MQQEISVTLVFEAGSDVVYQELLDFFYKKSIDKQALIKSLQEGIASSVYLTELSSDIKSRISPTVI